MTDNTNDQTVERWHERKDVTLMAGDELVNLDKFVKYCASKPLNEEIKVNKLANNSKYLPIATIERLLDEMFYGLWEVENYTTQVVANEITGIMKIRAFHPVARMWLSRVGVGAVQIRCRQGLPPSVENKITNALVADYPHLKAECLKNAAKSLGNIFGRNLNRDEDVKYIETLKDRIDIPDELIEKIEFQLSEAVNSEQVKKLYDAQEPEYKRNYLFREMFLKKIAIMKKTQ